MTNAEIDRLREAYEERAAIKEFLGNMPRAQAEAEARKEVYGPKSREENGNMSRSGYSESCEGWELICWRGAVASAIRGRRGQAFLEEMLAALDSLPNKRLIADDLEKDGEVCGLGSVGRARGMDMTRIDYEDAESVAKAFGIPRALASEIEFINDDEFGWRDTTPEQRFAAMRKWVLTQIRDEQAAAEA